ncbi:MAG: glycosyltransferase [Acidimicrobiales bacterium]
MWTEADSSGPKWLVLEAMAVGLPVIGTRVGGMEQLVLDPLGEEPADPDHPCGVLVEPGDGPALAAAIEALLSDQETYHAFSESSDAASPSTSSWTRP